VRNPPGIRNCNVDIVSLQYATEVGLISGTGPQPFDSGFFVAKGPQEGEGEFVLVERLQGEIGYCFFDFYCVHEDWGLGSVLKLLVLTSSGWISLSGG
jgi:hypothetical protein